MNVHSSPLHSSQKLETAQKSINIRLDKYIVEYSQNGILFSIIHKKYS